MIICSKCSHEKTPESFGLDTRSKTGRQARCRECQAADARDRRAANPDQTRERARQRYRSGDNRQKVAERNQNYYQRNKEALIAYTVEWQQKNPEKAQTYRWKADYKQRSIAASCTPVFGEDEVTRKAVVSLYGDRCWHCKTGLFEHLDHFPVAVGQGGAHTLENVRPSCVSCNLRLRMHTQRMCEVSGCDRDHEAKGLCSMHYQRSRTGKKTIGGPEYRKAMKR